MPSPYKNIVRVFSGVRSGCPEIARSPILPRMRSGVCLGYERGQGNAVSLRGFRDCDLGAIAHFALVIGEDTAIKSSPPYQTADENPDKALPYQD